MLSFRQLPIISRQTCPAIRLYCFLLLTLLVPQLALAAGQSTAFLPLKVNTGKDEAKLTAQADTLLAESLARHGISLIPRKSASQMADYDSSWPPSPATLQVISKSTKSDNVAAGNLSVIGNQVSIDLKVYDSLSPHTPQFFHSKVDSLSRLKTAINNVVLDVMAFTEREQRIATIAPEGNKRIDSGAILRKISSRAGGAYNPAALRDDLKAIYSMGYFNDVQIDVTEGPKGKNVVFRVVEKPTISSVTFTGIDELEEEDVRAAANIREHFILNPTAVNAGTEAIKALYKDKGYYNTQVNSDISFPNGESAVVAYTIEEGPKIYIKEINFEGNSAFDDDDLLDEIETSEKGLFSWITASGLLEMDVINQDTGKIVAFYNNHGYMEARVSEPKIEQKEEWLYLTFSIDEGPRFKVGEVDIAGELIVEKEELTELLTIVDEEYMDRSAVREDVMAITDLYAEKGYAFAEARPDMKKGASGEYIDLTYRIIKGELVYINRINIKGNKRTRDNVIRREIRLAEGGVFNSKALRESNQALQRLQFFEEVNVTPEPTIDPTRMNINIEVKERSTGTFSVGAGYSSVDSLILMGSISENNFLGRGDQLSLSASIGGSSSRYNLGYTNPHVNDSALSFGVDLFNTEREYDDYTKESVGGGIRVGYPLIEKWRIFGNYSYTDTDLSDISDDASWIIKESAKVEVTSSLTVSLVRDTRNRTFAATEGSRHVISVQHAGAVLGDAEFTKFEASTSWYFPLFMKTTLHVKGAVGYSPESNDDFRYPVYERFYLGGINTVRGFEYGKISPTDDSGTADGDRIGGSEMWYTNIEWIFPIVEENGIQGITFFDAGQVYGDIDDRGDDDPETAIGIGLRWLSPMGPLSLVWGYNLDPADDEDQSVFDFSIGGTF